ncbi:hypothetical protein TD95_002769 [Thielaviopsis punctulata]|uniref:HECT-type E3 ubiquitin transferase n=1 Tax=Thielaviopsis punctulata TaxID=72032 RepID=A0A0F4ZAY3_9PEZI|nr:hypothetical protein TD95_002769 [Thielaviopsis punctulata]
MPRSKSQKTPANPGRFRSASESGPGLSAVGGSSRDNGEFETGTCMTCTAAMRWPSSANAFRCIGCLAINDVVPRQLQQPEIPKAIPTSTEAPVHKIPRKPVNVLPSAKAGEGQILTASRSPHIEWDSLRTWYMSVINVAENWQHMYSRLEGAADPAVLASLDLVDFEKQLLVAQEHVQKALLKATEQLLKRPGKMLLSPDDIRFLIIVIENPLLGQEPTCFSGALQPDQPKQHHNRFSSELARGGAIRPITGYHSGIIKRILGLLANSAPACHKHLIQWFARYPLERFVATKDMASRFLAYRLTRHKEKRRQPVADNFSKLVPELSTESPARAQAAIETMIATDSSDWRRRQDNNHQLELAEVPRDDWQIVAAARVLSLLFRANDLRASKRSIYDARTKSRGQFVPTSDFYISMLDLSDLVDDFNFWDGRGSRFSFCQFPFLISIGAKKQILEHDAKRQMSEIMRETILAGVLSNSRHHSEHMLLDVRRECIVEDSLKGISDAVSRGGRDLWKKLRIVFHGEEGLDYGGLKKEWFLQLVREVFNPDHGMFVYDDDSHYCYFNPFSLENPEQYYLVGVVLGLAIYNSTILDVAFPPFAFRKLLAPTLADTVPRLGHSRPPMTYTLADLAEYRPQLAAGLQALLDYEGDDVEDVFCLNFVISLDRYGTPILVPLCPGGADTPVTAANRHEYVDLYVRYMLDACVARQFEPFRRGFWTVCGRSSALSLCRPEEVELLIRGSDETLDIESLQGVAIYENWDRMPDITRSSSSSGQRHQYRRVQPEDEPVVRWFWQTFKEASPENQRKLLVFITGSDRIPAGGAASLSIKISCLGNDVARFPIARTCFNTLALHRYHTREMLEAKLWTAVHESEGFGIK